MGISTNINIRPSEIKDIAAMLRVERSAAKAFLNVPELAWLAEASITSAESHKAAIKDKTSWAAEDELYGDILGFLLAKDMETELHIQEVSVDLKHQGQKIGRTLIETALEQARAKDFKAVTLTTFIDLPWNAPFYKKLGFEIIDNDLLEGRLLDILIAEERQGLPRGGRCAMRKSLTTK